MKQLFYLLFLPILTSLLLLNCDDSVRVGKHDDSHILSIEAAQNLLERWLPEYSDQFIFEVIQPESGKDVFEIETLKHRVVIRGNNTVSMASGLNWYLKYYCFCDISLFGVQLNLPQTLPPVKSKVRRISAHKYRYMLNYCSFGYTMVWWDWTQWEKLIDWMALNGVNMPLSVTGQEAVWREVAKRLEIGDLSDFLAGPPYLPFGWMGCLDGWGGPLSQNWIDKHRDLQKKILARERELSMTPVLQGFTGHVPPAVVKKFPDSKFQKINWIEWSTHILDPMDPLFNKIGTLFLEEQTKIYGTNHHYAADTFIEMVPPSGNLDYLGQMAKSILGGMTAIDPDAVWILQGWAFSANSKFWTPERLEAFLSAVPDEHIVLLDLFCEITEMWRVTEAFYGKPWVWCNIQTFGANVDLHGPLNRINQRLDAARKSPERGQLVGIGYVNEGFEGNPIAYEFLTEMTWHNEAVNIENWIDAYARARYGELDENARNAWEKLYQSVYGDTLSYGIFISANRYPRLKFGSGPPYDAKKVFQAWQLLLQAAEKLKDLETYSYDLISVGVQVLANYSYDLHVKLVNAFKSKDRKQFEKTSRMFLQVLNDLDELAGTHKDFLLGRWLEDAKRWSIDEQEKARMGWNARRILTLWGSGANLRDYSRRNWSGLFKGFYLPRWQSFISEMEKSLVNQEPFDEESVNKDILKSEAQWTENRDLYPHEPSGDYLDISRKMWAKYQHILH